MLHGLAMLSRNTVMYATEFGRHSGLTPCSPSYMPPSGLPQPSSARPVSAAAHRSSRRSHSHSSIFPPFGSIPPPPPTLPPEGVHMYRPAVPIETPQSFVVVRRGGTCEIGHAHSAFENGRKKGPKTAQNRRKYSTKLRSMSPCHTMWDGAAGRLWCLCGPPNNSLRTYDLTIAQFRITGLLRITVY